MNTQDRNYDSIVQALEAVAESGEFPVAEAVTVRPSVFATITPDQFDTEQHTMYEALAWGASLAELVELAS